MAKFCPLASSSAGNCTYIAASGGAVLVDAGISCRRITQALAELDTHPSALAAVLITHEHIDHIKGLRLLTARTGLAVYATPAVLDYLIEHDHVAPGTPLVEVGESPLVVGGMEVTAFHTSHDSVDSVGYRLVTPDGHAVAVATDLGEVTAPVDRGLAGCELVMLESNYDLLLLRMGPYPPFLKRRIASKQGHLPNDSCADLACRLIEQGTTRLVLAHLSRENNNPSLAYQTVDDALRACGAVARVDYELDVAPYDAAGRLVRL